jgi:tetratricopeptide (TPR) repeat protein
MKHLLSLLLVVTLFSCSSKEKEADKLYKVGEIKFNAEDYKGAIDEFTKVLELNSKYAMAYLFRGAAKFKIGNTEDGCNDMKKGFEIAKESNNPESWKAYETYYQHFYNACNQE